MVNYIRISEAAKELGVTRAGMYHIIETLGLPTEKIMGITAIDAAILKSDKVLNRLTPKNGRVKTKRLTGVK